MNFPPRLHAVTFVIVWLLRPGGLDRAADFTKAIPFQIFPHGPDHSRLTWTSTPGTRYVVQVSASFGVWNDVDVITAAGTTTTWIDPFPRTTGAGFYRLTLPQLEVTSIEPAVASSSGATTFYILGQCFTGTEQLFIDGVLFGGVLVFDSTGQMHFTVGGLAQSFEYGDFGLPNAVSAAGNPHPDSPKLDGPRWREETRSEDRAPDEPRQPLESARLRWRREQMARLQ